MTSRGMSRRLPRPRDNRLAARASTEAPRDPRRAMAHAVGPPACDRGHPGHRRGRRRGDGLEEWVGIPGLWEEPIPPADLERVLAEDDAESARVADPPGGSDR